MQKEDLNTPTEKKDSFKGINRSHLLPSTEYQLNSPNKSPKKNSSPLRIIAMQNHLSISLSNIQPDSGKYRQLSKLDLIESTNSDSNHSSNMEDSLQKTSYQDQLASASKFKAFEEEPDNQSSNDCTEKEGNPFMKKMNKKNANNSPTKLSLKAKVIESSHMNIEGILSKKNFQLDSKPHLTFDKNKKNRNSTIITGTKLNLIDDSNLLTKSEFFPQVKRDKSCSNRSPQKKISSFLKEISLNTDNQLSQQRLKEIDFSTQNDKAKDCMLFDQGPSFKKSQSNLGISSSPTKYNIRNVTNTFSAMNRNNSEKIKSRKSQLNFKILTDTKNGLMSENNRGIRSHQVLPMANLGSSPRKESLIVLPMANLGSSPRKESLTDTSPMKLKKNISMVNLDSPGRGFSIDKPQPIKKKNILQQKLTGRQSMIVSSDFDKNRDVQICDRITGKMNNRLLNILTPIQNAIPKS